jgi:hypothetical protein
MRIKREYFPSGKFSGISIFWSNYRYRTYIYVTTGWRGQFAYPKDQPRLLTSKPWWVFGGLMLITSRIEWKTVLWITEPKSYTVSAAEIDDNLYSVTSPTESESGSPKTDPNPPSD